MPRAFLVKRFGSSKEENEEVNNNDEFGDLCEINCATETSEQNLCNPSQVPNSSRVSQQKAAQDVGNILSRIVLGDCRREASSSEILENSESDDGSVELEQYELLELENESDSSAFSEYSSSYYPLGEVDKGCLNWKQEMTRADLQDEDIKFMLQHAKSRFKKGDLEYISLSKMLQDQSLGDGLKPQFQCNQCDKTFKTKYTLNIHRKMPSHTTLKPFVCPTCGKGFRLSSTLCRHKIIHTSQRPHRCHVCQKSFNRSSTLKTHLRTHSQQKEFACEICGKGFHQKGNLRNHVLIHTGEKPYQCSVCKKSFNKLSNLKFHMHSHTDQKPYRCRFCKQTFCKRGELKQHIARCRNSCSSGN